MLPVIPAQGSVGASGDLAPLAHLAAGLVGEGEALFEGAVMPAADALRRAGLVPATLGPKEGLALLNGTQVSTALALAGLFAVERAFQAAIVAGALTTDAARGSGHAVRGPHPGPPRAPRPDRRRRQLARPVSRQRHPRQPPRG